MTFGCKLTHVCSTETMFLHLEPTIWALRQPIYSQLSATSRVTVVLGKKTAVTLFSMAKDINACQRNKSLARESEASRLLTRYFYLQMCSTSIPVTSPNTSTGMADNQPFEVRSEDPVAPWTLQNDFLCWDQLEVTSGDSE